MNRTKSKCDLPRRRSGRPATGLGISLILGLVCMPGLLCATHIVGGEMTYRCLGDDQYEITLSVYRDCYYGAANAPFDDPAFIGVYDRNGLPVDTLVIPFTGDDTLSFNLNDPCLVFPGDVCVHTTVYRDTVYLPFRVGGYTLAYQRCCRNETIRNIINPLETGATFLIQLTEAALLRCNQTPSFRDWPPLFICAGKPLRFDHSATDADGDSLVYKLCTPFSGGSLGMPQPTPSSPPPYDTVIWNGPLYSLANLLGTGDPLVIDPATGLMTALPGTIGQFVVGVCVEEYDRQSGALLSVVKRDFQYNVGICGETLAAFFAPDVQCDNRTVTFENQSTDAESFEWIFDYPAGLLRSDTAAAAFDYTFPDTGRYTVALIARTLSGCADTAFRTVYLQDNSLSVDFRLDVFDCDTFAVLSLTDLSTDSISPVIRLDWLLSYGSTTLPSNETNPVFTLPLGISGNVSLTAESRNGCVQTATRPFRTGEGFPAAFLRDTLRACLGSVLHLNPDTPPGLPYDYRWSPGAGLDDSTAVNPALVVAGDGAYTVTITASGDLCGIVRTVYVQALPLPELGFEFSASCDSLRVEFLNTSQGASSFFWDFGDPATTTDVSAETDPAYTYPAEGRYLVTLATGAGELCPDTITREIDVVIPSLDLTISGDLVTCAEQTTLSASAEGAVRFIWRDQQGTILSNDPTLTIIVSGSTQLRVEAIDSLGCIFPENLTVSGGPADISVPDTVAVCFGEEVELSAVNLDPNDTLTYRWTPAEAFAGATETASPDYLEIPGPRTVFLNIENQFGCPYADSVHVAVVDPNAVYRFTSEVQCDGTTVVFSNTSTDAFGFIWDFGDGTISTGTDPVHEYAAPGEYTVSLTAVYDVSCADTARAIVRVEEPNLAAGFTYDLVECTSAGATVAFFDNSFADPYPVQSWSWAFSNGLSSSDQNPVIDVAGSGPLTATLTITSTINCRDSVAETIDIQLVNLDLPDTLVLCRGDSVVLNAGGSLDYGYEWTPAAGLSDPSAASPLAFPDETTVYTLTARNVAGSDTCTFTAQITVWVPPAIDLDLGEDRITCGEDVPIDAVAGVSVGIEWISFNEGPLGNGAQIVVNPFRRDTILALATDAFGCEDRDTIVITDNGLDVRLFPEGDLSACAGIDTTLTVVNLDPLDSLRYEWTPVANIISGADAATAIIVAGSGSVLFSVAISNQYDCRDTLRTTVTVVPFDPVLPDTVMACSGVPTPLNPDFTTGYSYQWLPAEGLSDVNAPNPVFSGGADILYSVSISYSSQGFTCMTVDTVQVLVPPPVGLGVNRDTTLCASADIPLTAFSEAAGVSYKWFDNPAFDPPVAGEGPSVLVRPEVSTAYYVLATDAFGCTENSRVQVTIAPVQASITPGQVFCEPVETVELSIGNADPLQTLTVTWSPAGAVAPDTGLVVDADPFLAEGFEAVVSNQFGCVDTLRTFIRVILLDDLTIDADPDTLFLGDMTTLTVGGCTSCTYEWIPPSGILSADDTLQVNAIPEEAGEQEYEVEVGKEGCFQTLRITVFVIPVVCDNLHVFLPNAFTPNADGDNDVLRLRSIFLEEIREMDLLIYNRWGEEVFRTRNPYDAWDGTFRGEPLPPDVYGFWLRVICPEEEELIQKGNITLLR